VRYRRTVSKASAGCHGSRAYSPILMPIKFRCPHCRQFLGISRAKAGEVSDCPMCGKTVRVPDLDGSVRPLPKPKLNLEDSSLVDALGELAGIGEGRQTVDRPVREKSPREAATIEVQPTEEPVILEPLAPAKPVSVAPAHGARRRRRQSQSPGDTSPTAPDEQVTFDEAIDVAPVITRGPALGRTARRPAPVSWRILSAVAGIVLLCAGGLYLMNRSVPEVASAGEDASDVSEDLPAAAIAIDETSEPAVTGRVTYVSEAGDTRPDDGAKVIALPTQRGGTVKLDVAGFLVGSSDVDASVAEASLRALGGDVVTTGGEGEYSLSLPQAGAYELLVISRHQSRPWEVGVESDVQELLDRFFIRPSTLLGQLAYEVQSLQYRGHGTSPRDFAFERQ